MPPRRCIEHIRLCGWLGIAVFFLPCIAAGQSWGPDIELASSYDSATTANPSDANASSGCDLLGEPCATSPCCSCPYNSCPGDSCSCGASLSDQFAARMDALAQAMQESGFVYAAGVTQFYQGVTSGGLEAGFDYGGKVDQFLILDSGKLGLWQGMTMTMHAETRFGQDVNNNAVGLAPVNVAMLYPKYNEHDTAITGLTFAQALGEEVQGTFGKFNALDLFYGLYPQTGRGVNGFMNASMVVPISVARVVPLSFMGAGVVKLSGKQMQGGLFVYDTQNVTTTSGFNNLFDNGANILGFWRFFTDFGGLPGSHMFAGIWSTGEFVAFDPTGFVIVPDEGIVAVPTDGAYTLLYILEQSLWVDCCDESRNITLLSQWGLADETTSPFGWSANIAIQAQGFSDARPQDSIGVGYFYTGLSHDFQDLLSPALTLQDVDGFELYYNMAVTKMFQVTADFQVVEPANVANDTAVVFGLRATLGM